MQKFIHSHSRGFQTLSNIAYMSAGMYTVMVAAMGRRVVAVDPILSNLVLINQSLQRADNAKHVSFVSNPIRCSH